MLVCVWCVGCDASVCVCVWVWCVGCDASLTTLTSLLQSLGCVEGVDILNKEKGVGVCLISSCHYMLPPERRVEHIDVPKASLSNRKEDTTVYMTTPTTLRPCPH